jgi:hypothetical protein
MHTLTKPQRIAMTRLAAAMPTGDHDRRIILAHLERAADMGRTALRLKQFQHMLGLGRQFGVLSAYGPGTKAENNVRNGDLIRDLQRRGYAYHPVKGSWEGVVEKSMLVPGMTFADLVELGTKYKQDSVIYKDPSGVIGMYYLKENKVTFATTEEGAMAVQMAVGDALYSKSRGISFEFGFAWGQKQPWNGTTPYTIRGLTRALAQSA